MEGAQRVGAVAVLVVAAAAGAWFGVGRRSEPPPMVVAEAPVAADEALTVHVAGEVVFPGLVSVEAGARVADALSAAGGVTPEAALDGLNLAAPLSDGLRILVPHRDAGGAAVGSAGDGRVGLNSAGVEELQTLPGVGPVLAGRIVAYRDDHGPFRAVEDLLDVPGIGEGRLAELREMVALS